MGVPMLPDLTGKSQATYVIDLITKWDLKDRLTMMCFDTTASNTGLINEACIRIEQELDKKLLSLACRYHIMDIIVGNVFD